MRAKVNEVETRRSATYLTEAAIIDDEELIVADLTALSQSASCVIGEEVFAHHIDWNNDRVLLGGALLSGYDADTEVFPKPEINQKYAVVVTAESEYEVEVDSGVWPQLPDGSREAGKEEQVVVEGDRLVSIIRQAPKITEQGLLDPRALAPPSLSVADLVITDNSPSGGEIAWSACTVTYEGIEYSIPSGNTTAGEKIIYWPIGAEEFRASDTPVFEDNPIPIIFNSSGTGAAVWSNVAAFGVIYALSIFAVYIQAQSITANMLNVDTLSAIQTIIGGSAGNQRIEIDGTAIKMYDSGNVLRIVFDDDSIEIYDTNGNLAGSIRGGYGSALKRIGTKAEALDWMLSTIHASNPILTMEPSPGESGVEAALYPPAYDVIIGKEGTPIFDLWLTKLNGSYPLHAQAAKMVNTGNVSITTDSDGTGTVTSKYGDANITFSGMGGAPELTAMVVEGGTAPHSVTGHTISSSGVTLRLHRLVDSHDSKIVRWIAIGAKS